MTLPPMCGLSSLLPCVMCCSISIDSPPLNRICGGRRFKQVAGIILIFGFLTISAMSLALLKLDWNQTSSRRRRAGTYYTALRYLHGQNKTYKLSLYTLCQITGFWSKNPVIWHKGGWSVTTFTFACPLHRKIENW